VHARFILASAFLCAASSFAGFFGPAFNVPGVGKKGLSLAIDGQTLYCGGLWAIPCEKAKFRPQNRGKLPPDAKWRELYTTPEGSHFRAWQPPTRGQVHSVAACRGVIYAGCSYAGAFAVDARTLKTLARIPCKYARDVAVRNGRLYVAQGDDGIGVYSLEDPVQPKEVRRISEIAPGVCHCEWLYVFNDRWAVCHPRRNSGSWYFLDISKTPAVFAGKALGMDWVRPFADELVGGKWLGYAQTHRFFKWYDMSGDKPTLLDTEDKSLSGPIQKRPNFIGSQSCCAPHRADGGLRRSDEAEPPVVRGDEGLPGEPRVPRRTAARALRLPGRADSEVKGIQR